MNSDKCSNTNIFRQKLLCEQGICVFRLHTVKVLIVKKERKTLPKNTELANMCIVYVSYKYVGRPVNNMYPEYVCYFTRNVKSKC